MLGGSFIIQPMLSLAASWDDGLQSVQDSSRLGDLIPPGSRVASDTEFNRTLYLSFYKDLKYFGTVRASDHQAGATDELRKYRIEYLLLYRGAPGFRIDPGWIEVSGGRISDMLIYKLPLVPDTADQSRRPFETGLLFQRPDKQIGDRFWRFPTGAPHTTGPSAVPIPSNHFCVEASRIVLSQIGKT